jgi:hypothetical protein
MEWLRRERRLILFILDPFLFQKKDLSLILPVRGI